MCVKVDGDFLIKKMFQITLPRQPEVLVNRLAVPIGFGTPLLPRDSARWTDISWSNRSRVLDHNFDSRTIDSRDICPHSKTGHNIEDHSSSSLDYRNVTV